MQQGKQVLVNNSGPAIFSALWFLFGTKCSTEKTFRKPSFWERQIKQVTVADSEWVHSKGLRAGAASDPSFQVQLQTRGRGRKAEEHNLCLLIQPPVESERSHPSI